MIAKKHRDGNCGFPAQRIPTGSECLDAGVVASETYRQPRFSAEACIGASDAEMSVSEMDGARD